MNQDTIKTMLLELYKTDVDFSVTFTGKSSKQVNGLYKPAIHEILLHNKNFKSDNQMIYTAIHEYAHHLVTCHSPAASTRSHSVEFWATFHDLLDTAEEKGFYQLIAGENKEKLSALVEGAKKIYVQIAELEKELAIILGELYQLGNADETVRYEDVIDRKLQMSRASVDKICAVSHLQTEMASDVKKVISKIKNPVKRDTAIAMYNCGKSPAQIKLYAASKNSVANRNSDDTNKDVVLLKEKKRLERTIEQLKIRLEKITTILSEKLGSVDENENDFKVGRVSADRRRTAVSSEGI